jgi:glutamine synthetase
MADNLYYKYIIRMIAKKHGKVATFMPKPLFGDNGSGMHVHQSLWKGDTNLFFDAKGYSLLSQTALLHRRPAQARAGAAGHVRSHHQLLSPPGAGLRGAGESGLLAAQSLGGGAHSGLLEEPQAKRLEFRCPDPSANPYLCFAALLMAGLDGIKNKIDPGEPLEKDLYELEPEEAAKIKSTPGSLGEVLTRSRRTTTSCSRAASSPRT